MKSDQGLFLCGGIKGLGEPGRVIGLHDTGFTKGRLKLDKKLAGALRDAMEEYDGWITWNGLMFDLPYLDDRLMFCGERAIGKRFARGLDMMWHARMGKARMTSSRLDWVAKVMGCPYEKTGLNMNTWKEAEAEAFARFKQGHDNYDYIVDHCLHDLLVTEWVYEKLKHRVQTISKR